MISRNVALRKWLRGLFLLGIYFKFDNYWGFMTSCVKAINSSHDYNRNTHKLLFHIFFHCFEHLLIGRFPIIMQHIR